MEIGIIGYGRFGKLAAGYLCRHFKVYVYDSKKSIINSNNKNIIYSAIDKVCKKDIVILAVPISELENVLLEIKSFLKAGSLAVDVCSVKELPAKLMEKILPKNVQILATHPIFGPDSAKDSLRGRKIVLCRTRISEEFYRKIKENLENAGLIVIEATPEEHDREIAKTLLLTHFIGRGLMEFGAKELSMDTEGYKRLLKILETVRNDTSQLFNDMNAYNKYSKGMRTKLINALIKVNKRLGK